MNPTIMTIGTVSHGTLRTEDLLPAFAAELRRVTSHPGNLTLAAEAEAIMNFESEEASELCNDLIELLNEYAPEGMYFGAHEGDGSDFGWWPCADTSELERPGGCGAARLVLSTWRHKSGLHCATADIVSDGQIDWSAKAGIPLPRKARTLVEAQRRAQTYGEKLIANVAYTVERPTTISCKEK